MVFYYTTSDGHLIYMGRDKYENEDLIKYGWDEDLWFHVDDLSSAHVYLRMKDGETWDALSVQLIEECSQLVKANSIQGCKQSSVKIVYTPWNNLLKTLDMEVGAVGFKDEKLKKYHHNVERNKDILKVIQKTQQEDKQPDFAKMKEDRRIELKKIQVKKFKEQQAIDRQMEKEKRIQEELRSYDHMFDPAMMKSNHHQGNDDEDDDFM